MRFIWMTLSNHDNVLRTTKRRTFFNISCPWLAVLWLPRIWTVTNFPIFIFQNKRREIRFMVHPSFLGQQQLKIIIAAAWCSCPEDLKGIWMVALSNEFGPTTMVVSTSYPVGLWMPCRHSLQLWWAEISIIIQLAPQRLVTGCRLLNSFALQQQPAST